MKAGRLPSSGITRSLRYYSPLRLLACLSRFSVALIPSHRGHHPRQTRSPALPTTTSLTSRPDDPGESIDDDRFCPHRRLRPSPSDNRVGTLDLQVTRLCMGSWIVRSVCLRFSVLRSLILSFSIFRVFSIRLALRVTSQNRIFANGVNRQFPAPDFNRLVVLLPRRTVRLD